MKSKILNFLLIITSLFGYLEWSGNSHMFLFQAEGEIILKLFTHPTSVIHPFTVLPMIGQIILLITLFQKKPNKTLTYIGMGGLGILLTFMFFIGVISLNSKILFSTIPFLIISIFTIKFHRNIKA